jgi:hypothetical protein
MLKLILYSLNNYFIIILLIYIMLHSVRVLLLKILLFKSDSYIILSPYNREFKLKYYKLKMSGFRHFRLYASRSRYLPLN